MTLAKNDVKNSKAKKFILKNFKTHKNLSYIEQK